MKTIYGIEVEPDYVSFAGPCKNDIEVYMNHEGDVRTPSMVLFNKDSTVDVGLIAQYSAELEPEMVVAPIENYNITINFPYKYENQLFDDKEIVALILKKVIKDIKKQKDIDVVKTVISYPAYYSKKQIDKIRTAGVLAELNVCDMIPDSIALLHLEEKFIDEHEGEDVLIVILHESHISASIVRIESGNVELYCASGTNSIGGWQWNSCMENHIVNLLRDKYDDSKFEMYDEEKFYIKNEAKYILDFLTEGDERLFQSRMHGQKQRIHIKKNEFMLETEHLTNQVINFINEMVAQAYSDGKINHNRVNAVMLAGNYAYWIQKELKRKLDADVFTCESDNSIVKGAVMYGEKLKKRIEKLDRTMNGVSVDIKL